MKQKIKAALNGDFGRLLVLLAIFFGFAVFERGGAFMTWGNIQNILIQSSVVGMAAIGATLIIISAGIDLSVGSMLALSMVVVAKVLEGPQEEVTALLPMLAVCAGVLTGVLCGVLNGVMISRFGMVPFIATLSTMGIFRGTASAISNSSNIYTPSTWIPKLMVATSSRAGTSWMLLPTGVWLVLICCVLMGLVLRYTRLGRHLFAVGSNEETARLCGVHVKNVKLCAYGLAGLFGGLAGVLMFSYIGMGQPTSGEGYELKVIAAVVIGGASLKGGEGTIAGTIIEPVPERRFSE